PALLEVLLDLRVLVVDGERDLDAARDDLRPEAAGGRLRDLAREDERDPVGAAERQLVAQRLLEPGPAGLGTVEDTRVGELELAEGEVVAVAAAAIVGCQRLGQPLLPAAEEAPELIRTEPVAERLQRRRVGADAKARVERVEG